MLLIFNILRQDTMPVRFFAYAIFPCNIRLVIHIGICLQVNVKHCQMSPFSLHKSKQATADLSGFMEGCILYAHKSCMSTHRSIEVVYVKIGICLSIRVKGKEVVSRNNSGFRTVERLHYYTEN